MKKGFEYKNGSILSGWILVFIGLFFEKANGNENRSPAYTNPPRTHYEVILERMPFGRPPPPQPDPAPEETPDPEPAGPSPEEVQFYRRHKLVALTRTDSGIGVGFVDSGQKPPRNYFAQVGEEVDGYEIVSAEFSDETVDIRKDGNRYTLKLGQGAPGAEGTGKPGPPAAVPVRPGSSADDDRSGNDTSYVERMRRRREALLDQRRREAEQSRKEMESKVERLTGEALQKHLRELNMELIRAGGEMGPPLPIELTPEEDAKLVEEGVLPPPE